MPSPRMPSLERANAISSPPPAVAARASMCASVSLELRLLPSPWMPSLERPSTSSSPPPAVAVRASMLACIMPAYLHQQLMMGSTHTAAVTPSTI
eukprot:1159827-Pelagomonas_calceolata.AAC.15